MGRCPPPPRHAAPARWRQWPYGSTDLTPWGPWRPPGMSAGIAPGGCWPTACFPPFLQGPGRPARTEGGGPGGPARQPHSGCQYVHLTTLDALRSAAGAVQAPAGGRGDMHSGEGALVACTCVGSVRRRQSGVCKFIRTISGRLEALQNAHGRSGRTSLAARSAIAAIAAPDPLPEERRRG